MGFTVDTALFKGHRSEGLMSVTARTWAFKRRLPYVGWLWSRTL